jgi:hypothetical protein
MNSMEILLRPLSVPEKARFRSAFELLTGQVQPQRVEVIGDNQADLRRRQVPPLHGVRTGLADLLDRETEFAEHKFGLTWPLPSAEVLRRRNESTTTILQIGVAEAGSRDRIGGGGRKASGPVGPTPGGRT